MSELFDHVFETASLSCLVPTSLWRRKAEWVESVHRNIVRGYAYHTNPALNPDVRAPRGLPHSVVRRILYINRNAWSLTRRRYLTCGAIWTHFVIKLHGGKPMDLAWCDMSCIFSPFCSALDEGGLGV